MRILILGGTQFLGHEIAQTLLAVKHSVTIFNRGKSPYDLPPEVERLRGVVTGSSRSNALAGRNWDVCMIPAALLLDQSVPAPNCSALA